MCLTFCWWLLLKGTQYDCRSVGCALTNNQTVSNHFPLTMKLQSCMNMKEVNLQSTKILKMLESVCIKHPIQETHCHCLVDIGLVPVGRGVAVTGVGVITMVTGVGAIVVAS